MTSLGETIRNRARFYQDGLLSSKRLNYILSVFFGLSVLFNIVLAATPARERYIPMGPGCAMQPIYALDEPYLSTSDVLEYAADAVVGVYTYSSANFDRDLSMTSGRFTDEAWDAWINAINENGTLDYVVTHGAMVTAYANDQAPTVLDQGIGIAKGAYADRYAWRVQVPFNVTYLSSGRTVNQSLVGQLVVVRRPYGEDPYFKGLGISSLIAR